MPDDIGAVVRGLARQSPPGGMVVIAGCGWNGHDAQPQGLDDFARRHDRAVLALPTGQGLLVK